MTTSSHIKTIWTHSWNSQNSWFRQQQRSRDTSLISLPATRPHPGRSQHDKNEFPQQWRTLNLILSLIRFITSAWQVLLLDATHVRTWEQLGCRRLAWGQWKEAGTRNVPAQHVQMLIFKKARTSLERCRLGFFFGFAKTKTHPNNFCP